MSIDWNAINGGLSQVPLIGAIYPARRQFDQFRVAQLHFRHVKQVLRQLKNIQSNAFLCTNKISVIDVGQLFLYCELI